MRAQQAAPDDASISSFKPSGVFDGEKLRGILTSLAAGGTSGGLNFALVGAGLGPELSAFIGMYVIGSLLSYTFDIMFAKRNFPVRSGTTEASVVQLAYTDFAGRGVWLLRSLLGKYFYRFVVTVLLDSLVGIILLRAAIRQMDKLDFLTDFAFRDAFVAAGISVFTFLLYNNILRFDWAYSDVNDPILNVVILMWTTLIVVAFAVTYGSGGRDAAPDVRRWAGSYYSLPKDEMTTIRSREEDRDSRSW